MHQHKSTDYDFETGIYRPPSEGGAASLLLRLTRNCPWNHCTFCAMYKTQKFSLRTPKEVINEIDTMADIKNELVRISENMGTEGRLTQKTVTRFFQSHPDLYFHHGLSMLVNWFASGEKTVFLQDADSLIMKTSHIIQILEHLTITFPAIERITTYARSKTIVKKPFTDLSDIRRAGLSRVHIGLESGDAVLLKKIRKGSTPEDHIKGGQKALEAGFQVSEYWMPGLGGDERSQAHARHTADVLNRINPHYIRSRPFTVRPGSPLYDEFVNNGFKKMDPKSQLEEIKLMVEALTVTSKVCFDHAGNFWKTESGDYVFSHNYEGYKFPEQKQTLLKRIDQGISRKIS